MLFYLGVTNKNETAREESTKTALGTDFLRKKQKHLRKAPKNPLTNDFTCAMIQIQLNIPPRPWEGVGGPCWLKADRKPLAVFHHQECHRPLAVCIGIDRAKPDTCPNEGTSRWKTKEASAKSMERERDFDCPSLPRVSAYKRTILLPHNPSAKRTDNRGDTRWRVSFCFSRTGSDVTAQSALGHPTASIGCPRNWEKQPSITLEKPLSH